MQKFYPPETQLQQMVDKQKTSFVECTICFVYDLQDADNSTDGHDNIMCTNYTLLTCL